MSPRGTSPSVATILADARHNGVYRLKSPSASVPTLDGRVLLDKQALLEALGWALAFPDYYGANWDALEECLTDMSWWQGAIALGIDHADQADPESLGILIEIFAQAAEDWQDQGRPCSLFLSGLEHGSWPLTEAEG
ncbi:MAG: barstar family protein [Pseudomonadota bacterium]